LASRRSRWDEFKSESRQILTASDDEGVAYEAYLDDKSGVQIVSLDADVPRNAPGHGLFTLFLLKAIEWGIREAGTVDLSGRASCDASCVVQLKQVAEKMRDKSVAVPLESVYLSVADEMQKFFHNYNQRRAETNPINQQPRYHEQASGLPFRLLHYENFRGSQ